MAVIALSFFSDRPECIDNAEGKIVRGYLHGRDCLLVYCGQFGFLMLSIFNTNVIATLVSFHGLVHQISSAAVVHCLLCSRPDFDAANVQQAGVPFFCFLLRDLIRSRVTVLTLLAAGYYRDVYTGLMERGIAGFNLSGSWW